MRDEREGGLGKELKKDQENGDISFFISCLRDLNLLMRAKKRERGAFFNWILSLGFKGVIFKLNFFLFHGP